MKNINLFCTMVACISLSISAIASAESGESIILDPSSEDYILEFYVETENGEKILQGGKFVPATKIIPTIKSQFSLGEAGTIAYRYTISSGMQSKQLLNTLRFDPVPQVVNFRDFPVDRENASVEEMVSIFDTNRSSLIAPAGWRSAAFPSRFGGWRISWGSLDTSKGGLQPGQSARWFGLNSHFLPSIGMAEMEGAHGIRGYGGGGPSGEIRDQLDILDQNDFVPRFAAVPTIAVPTPFDAALLVERIQANMHTWIGMKLLDATFSSQLDRSLTAAADAYRHNQLKAGRDHIQDVRLLLKQAYADIENEDIVDEDTGNNQGAQFKNGMIARLAARVLDFNIKYVLKQLGEK